MCVKVASKAECILLYTGPVLPAWVTHASNTVPLQCHVGCAVDVVQKAGEIAHFIPFFMWCQAFLCTPVYVPSVVWLLTAISPTASLPLPLCQLPPKSPSSHSISTPFLCPLPSTSHHFPPPPLPLSTSIHTILVLMG